MLDYSLSRSKELVKTSFFWGIILSIQAFTVFLHGSKQLGRPGTTFHGDTSTQNPRCICRALRCSPPFHRRRGEREKAKGFFCETIPLIHHQRVTVVFANSAPLNQVLKHKHSALPANWILSMKIARIIQRRACLLPYLKGLRRATSCCLIAIGLKNHPFLRPAPASAASSSFLAPCAARSPKSNGDLLRGIPRGETPPLMMM